MAKQKAKPVILITNDDGITAPGIRNLVEAVKDLGKVVVVAPDKPQSGMGHAITIGQTLRMHKVEVFGETDAWLTTGTTFVCVKLTVDKYEGSSLRALLDRSTWSIYFNACQQSSAILPRLLKLRSSHLVSLR